jgi:hypothetical protein
MSWTLGKQPRNPTQWHQPLDEEEELGRKASRVGGDPFHEAFPRSKRELIDDDLASHLILADTVAPPSAMW